MLKSVTTAVFLTGGMLIAHQPKGHSIEINNNSFIAKEKPGKMENLALKKNGAWVITSSFNNYNTAYHDNLIDDNPETVWTPKENEFPYYIELRWKYPVKVNKISWNCKGNTLEDADILSWDYINSKWYNLRKVTIAELKEAKVLFSTTETNRVRIVLKKGTEKPVISEIAAYGPEQPIPEKNIPYWKAEGIWYPEFKKAYKIRENRFFVKTFEIDNSKYISAYLQAISSGDMEIYINGKKIPAEKSFPVNVIDFIKTGTNIIAVKTMLNRSVQWGAGAIVFQLDIHYANFVKNIITDATWKSTNVCTENWNKREQNNSDWKNAVSLFRLPDGPWGKIKYVDTAPLKNIELIKADMTPSVIPGGEGLIKLCLGMSENPSAVSNYFLTVDVGTESSTENFILARKVEVLNVYSSKDKKAFFLNADIKLNFPLWASSGKKPVIVHVYDVKSKSEMQITNIKNNCIGFFVVNRKEAMANPDKVSSSKVTYTNGQASFVINGKVETPFFWRYMWKYSLETFYNHNKLSDIHINAFKVKGVVDVNSEACQKELQSLDKNISELLKISPKSYIMVVLDLRPTPKWIDTNPSERLINAFGEKDTVSYASKKYRKDSLACIETIIEFLKNKPYASHVIGYVPWTCGMPDSGLGGVAGNVWQKKRSKITVGDYNSQAIELFRDFLRKKYKNDINALRKSWNKEDISFETAHPDIKKITEPASDGQVFRNPKNCMMTFDYAEFLPTMIGRTYQAYAALIKKLTDNKALVFIHYGYTISKLAGYNTPGVVLNNNNFDLPELLKDSNIDGYIGASHYGYRHIGMPLITYFLWSSIRLNGRLYIVDDDNRYYTAGFTTYGRNYSLRESEALITRNVGAYITRNIGAWFADMSKGEEGRTTVSWTAEKEIIDVINKVDNIYKTAIKNGYRSAAEIAVVFSPKTVFFNDIYNGPTLYENLINRMFYGEFFRLGAPFDVYDIEDLGHPDFPENQYKLYIMMNSFYLLKEDWRNIDKIRKNATMLWFYAPGYIDEKKGLCSENISLLTGIKVEEIPGKEQMKACLSKSKSQIIKNLNSDYKFEIKGFKDAKSAELHPTEFGPKFRITDSTADILANFSDGKGAIAVKNMGDWKSVYSIIPNLDADILRRIAKYAGVHIYTEDNLPFDANKNFIVVSNGFQKEKTCKIDLPSKADISNALTGEKIASNTNSFAVNMKPCSSLIFHVDHKNNKSISKISDSFKK